MDAFEQVVSEILVSQGFWVQTSYKVELTKEEKRQIGRPSCPRWELDIVAYRGIANELVVVECKSFFDSTGVSLDALKLDGPCPGKTGYKLFSENKLRKVVFKRLRSQLSKCGACSEEGEVSLALACGKIKSDEDKRKLREEFCKRNWSLFDSEWLKEGLEQLASSSYENQVSSVVSKILLR